MFFFFNLNQHIASAGWTIMSFTVQWQIVAALNPSRNSYFDGSFNSNSSFTFTILAEVFYNFALTPAIGAGRDLNKLPKYAS